MVELGRGSKDSESVAGAPFQPAEEHSDGPEHPRRDVPTADEDAEQRDPEQEEDGT